VGAEALGEALLALGQREQRVGDAQQELKEDLPGLLVQRRTAHGAAEQHTNHVTLVAAAASLVLWCGVVCVCVKRKEPLASKRMVDVECALAQGGLGIERVRKRGPGLEQQRVVAQDLLCGPDRYR
jgi:hypothetical protein